jgi:two-component system LytT family response regulator
MRAQANRLQVVILEDEPHAALQLAASIRAWEHTSALGVEVSAVAESVRDAVALLRDRPAPDLVFADIRLADGLSFRVFDEVRVDCPVVFATAYDQYAIAAMTANAIDYLLKPIEPARVARALDKYLRLREHFRGKVVGLASALSSPYGEAARVGRVLARKGPAFVPLSVDRIAWFTTEHKLTLVVDVTGARLVVDESLGELEARLDPRAFFRLNRQVLAQASAVKRFRSGGKGKLLVTLEPPADDEVVVSQEIAASFREWMAGAR